MKKLISIFILCVFLVSGCDKQDAKKDTISESLVKNVHVFLESGFARKSVSISYNGKEIWAGVPGGIENRSKAYSVHVGLRVKNNEVGTLRVNVIGVNTLNYNVNWAKGSMLSAKMKKSKIIIVFPKIKGYM